MVNFVSKSDNLQKHYHMKKIFTAVLAAASVMGMYADDVVIYNNGQLNGDITVYGWWNDAANFGAQNPTDANSMVFSFKAADGGAAASMGLFTQSPNLLTGPLHSATLNFSWYATTPAVYHIRLTGGQEQDYVLTVTDADVNKWSTIALPVEEYFPAVATAWNDYKENGTGYVFGITMDGGVAETVLYLNNIYYSNIDLSWETPYVEPTPVPATVPAIAQDKADVLSVFSADGRYDYQIGGWGQATKVEYMSVEGKDVMLLSNFNYLGLTMESNPIDLTGYTHMHVDYWPVEGDAFGFVPISLDPTVDTPIWFAPAVNLKEWNSYDVELSYFSCDKSAVKQIKFDANGYNDRDLGYIANIYFYKGEGETPEPPMIETGGVYSEQVEGSVEQTFEGVTNNYPYLLDYSIRYNDDKTLTIEATYEFTDGEPFGMVEGSAFIDGQLNNFVFANTRATEKRVLTTTSTYEPGEKLNVEFYIPAGAGAVLKNMVEYVVGSRNDDVLVSTVDAADEAPVFYTLQGVRVSNPEKGLYIRVRNGKATKVIF